MGSSEMTLVLPLLTIVGSLVGGFGGVWLGRYLERGNETIKWRRDRLLDAYSEFLRAVDMAVEASWAVSQLNAIPWHTMTRSGLRSAKSLKCNV
jgi:membrane protein YqaA with SNARE-associated domain